MSASSQRMAWCFGCGQWSMVNVSSLPGVPQQSAQCDDCEEKFYRSA